MAETTARQRLTARVGQLTTAQLREVDAGLVAQIRTHPTDERELRIVRLAVTVELDRRHAATRTHDDDPRNYRRAVQRAAERARSRQPRPLFRQHALADALGLIVEGEVVEEKPAN